MSHGEFYLSRAQTTLKTAESLLGRKEQDWVNIYFLAGLSVEHAMWAVRCRKGRLMEADYHVVPGHSLQRLLNHAGLNIDLTSATRQNGKLWPNWLAVRDWDSNRRYQQVGPVLAKDTLEAVRSYKYGVMSWLKEVYQSLP